MKIVQSGKYYVLYNDVGKIVIISRDKRVCSEILNSMEQFGQDS
jgi:hypothetical protein